jgi:hypothetical protein
MKRLVLMSALFLGACSTPKTMYDWGNYSSALLVYSQNPQATKAFADKLAVDIEKAEAKNRVPPGMYAEYGYAMLELNQDQQALAYFAKERDKWPESAMLMNGLIARVNRIKPATTSLPDSAPAAPVTN